jgi:transposase-like protein
MNCYYEFENTYFKDTSKNITLIFEHSGNSNDNKLDFFIIIMLYPKSNSPHIFDLTKTNFKNTKETIDLKHYTSFSLFIDVAPNTNVQESISISLNYIDNKKLSPIVILLIILGGLIFIILVILAISIIKSKLNKNQRTGNRNSIRNNRNNVEPTQEELEKMGKMKKIKQLIERDLVPQYYSKELDDKEYNGCTICLKKFRDNISKISILPCNHIFHYKCLYDWLINNQHWKCPICNFDLTENVKSVARSNKASKDQINIMNLNPSIPTVSSNEIISLNVNTNN